jgi:hypothetical protein
MRRSGPEGCMVEFNPEKFLDTPIYALDFQFMIGDVKAFLEFSESNIEWQYRRELQAISHQNFDDDELPKDVKRLEGFSLENWHFLGDQVCIRQGAIEPYIDHLAALVVDLHRAMSEQGLMQP